MSKSKNDYVKQGYTVGDSAKSQDPYGHPTSDPSIVRETSQEVWIGNWYVDHAVKQVYVNWSFGGVKS